MTGLGEPVLVATKRLGEVTFDLCWFSLSFIGLISPDESKHKMADTQKPDTKRTTIAIVGYFALFLNP